MAQSSTPVNNPVAGPAYSTRSRTQHRPTSPAMDADAYAEETDPGVATTYEDAPEPTQTTASATNVTLSISMKNNSLDSHIAPPFYFGRSTEDAFEFVNYVEKFAAYKDMSEDEKVKFVAVLLREAAADFFDALTAATTTSAQDGNEQTLT